MNDLTRITVINELREKIKNEKTKMKTNNAFIYLFKQGVTVSEQEVAVSEQIITNSKTLIYFYEDTLNALIYKR